jgi:nucleoside-diphosphate-sugar epimerase
MQPERNVALVLGANGGIGHEVTNALLWHGWTVRALVRREPDRSNPTNGIVNHPRMQWVVGDAMLKQDVVDAARGASVIVHAVNPAKYHNWRGLALPMLENTIAAASMFYSTVLFPGTIYNYGDDADAEADCLLDEGTPQNPRSRKGAIRVEMEEMLRDASWDRIRTIIVRAGDFFGPNANSSWFSQGIVQQGKPVRWIFNPGPDQQIHTWAYLPDVAEAMVRLLAKRHTLAAFDTFHFRGHVLRNEELIDAVCRQTGLSHRRVLRFPWWAINAASPFVELCNEMREMRYLWKTPHKLSNAKLRDTIGAEPHTLLDEAVHATLVGIGCLRADSSDFARGAA